MKLTVEQFRKFLKEYFEKMLENTDRERQAKHGYDLVDDGPGTNYNDLDEEVADDGVKESADVTEEDADRVRRHEDGYGDDLEEDVEIKESKMPSLKEFFGKDEDDEEDDMKDKDEKEDASC